MSVLLQARPRHEPNGAERHRRSRSLAPSIRTVFSVDGSRYLHWQSELLAYSHRLAGQPGGLTRLWSGASRPTSFAGDTVWAEPYVPHPVTGDPYLPYNKPAAIREWLSAACPPEETVLVVDPDCVFVRPVTATVERGRPAAQPYSYLRPSANEELVSRHCRRPLLVQGIGIPYLIHRDDLAVLAPLWLAKTEAIRADRRSRKMAGWIAEMWGYAFAAAELGLVHDLRELTNWNVDDRVDRPIIHYANEIVDRSNGWRWHKEHYRPWEPVPPPGTETPAATVRFVDLLNRLAIGRPYSLET